MQRRGIEPVLADLARFEDNEAPGQPAKRNRDQQRQPNDLAATR